MIEIILLYILIPILIYTLGYIMGNKPKYLKDTAIKHIKFRNGLFTVEQEYDINYPVLEKVTLLTLNTVQQY